MTNIDDLTVGSIVAQDWNAAAVFEKYNIDFCCNGGTKLSQACAAANIDQFLILVEIAALPKQTDDSEPEYNLWELDRLAEYIENKHHRYATNVMPLLLAYLNKICLMHGQRHPELLKIRDLFREMAHELVVHMKKEEFMIFPFIKKMTESHRQKINIPLPTYGSVKNPISIMMNDHEAEGAKLREIVSLSNNYTPPQDACNTYRLSYSMLQKFEQDIHKHIHLENNILFPKTLELEKKLVDLMNRG